MNTMLVTGTPVLSHDGGARLGKIDRVYLDAARKEIVAFSVRRERRVLRPGAAVVDVGDVHAFGPDAVTLADPARLLSPTVLTHRGEELVDLGGLTGRPVVTEGGTGVGRVVAVAVDPITLRLQRLEVEAPGCPVPGLVWGHEVLHLQGDLVVVAEAVLAPEPAEAARPIRSAAARRSTRPSVGPTGQVVKDRRVGQRTVEPVPVTVSDLAAAFSHPSLSDAFAQG